ncbi:MAG: T9SS type A sorting domain-containing protein [Bacteroidales bacterium]|nr:T9SS type A sorting domain-containing protein [Bacteroidales bacterium]
MRKKIYLFFALLLLGGMFRSYSQCLMLETSLNDRVQVSPAIFEGKVINSSSFWNEQHTSIFTSNIIEVYKVFKGGFTASQVEVITPGGIVGTSMEIETPSLELVVGETGIFLVQKSKVANSPSLIPDNLRFQSFYAASQDFIKYDLVEKTANDVFHNYKNIENEVYAFIVNQTGLNYKVIKSFDINTTEYHKADKSALAPAITSFSPNPITAGTFSVLTINGSGFGASYTGSAKVEFKNADDGGATYTPNIASNIISWSATQIQVQVPKKAGTGTIRVTDNAGSVSPASSSSLTVTYAELTALSGSVETQIKQANQNSAGGYTLVYNTGFKSNAPATAAFERALNTWRCGIYVNFSASPTTTGIAAHGQDGTSLVTFDGSDPIASPFLGMTNSYWNACCPSSTCYWTLTEYDIRFSANATGNTWNFGPAATSGNKIDFESVCLHELGHGVQIGHLIDVDKLMHWQISSNKDNRTLTSATDIAAGNDILTRSLISHPCGPTAITKLTSGNCSLGIESNEQYNNNISFYPNPFENSTVLHTTNMVGKQITLVIFDLLGNKIKQIQINSEDYTLTRDNMISGMYFYQIKDNENVLGSGKLIITD